MSETFAENLKRFTPDSAGLDRDALLFAAGRASARRHPLWAAAAGLLLASQMTTLVLLWPRPHEALEGPVLQSVPPFVSESKSSLPPSSTLDLNSDRHLLLSAASRELPPAVFHQELIEPETPLRAFPLQLPDWLR
jgi:hypothetical protein